MTGVYNKNKTAAREGRRFFKSLFLCVKNVRFSHIKKVNLLLEKYGDTQGGQRQAGQDAHADK